MCTLDELIKEQKYKGCELDIELLNKHIEELELVRNYELVKDIPPK